MGKLKAAYYNLVGAGSISLLKTLAGIDVLLPYHHLVSDEKLAHIHHLYPYKGTKAFEEDLDYLLKHFSPITPAELEDCICNKKPTGKNRFLLTFDDGLREVYDIVAPLLLKKGVPAIFFINSDFIDNAELFYRYKCSLLMDAMKSGKVTETQQQEALKIFTTNGFSGGMLPDYISKLRYAQKHLADAAAAAMNVSFADYLQKQQPYLTGAQVKELHQQGFAIGSHSADHPFYDKLPLEEQLRQTILPFKFLDELGITERYFAFPHTDKGVSAEFFTKIFEHPAYPAQLIFGTNNQKTDIDNRILQRFNCENPEISIGQSVKGILLYHWLHKATGKNTVKRD